MRSISLAAFLAQACVVLAHRELVSTVQGFDISHWQASVDFLAAYNSATEGTTTKDPKYHDHVTGAANVGFVIGAYHFARPGSSNGSAQATFFLAYGGRWTTDGMTLPGMLDIENNPSGPQCYGLSQSKMVSWIVEFALRAPVLWCWQDMHLRPAPSGWSSYTIWQNSSSYRYGGDSDIFNGDETALLGLASGTSTERFWLKGAAEMAAQKAIRKEAHDAPANSPAAFYINLTMDSDQMSRATEDPWSESKSVTFRDGSVSLLCVCSGGGSATMTILPWRLPNSITVRNAYMRHGTRPDPVTGRTVDFFAGVGAGGVRMVGDSNDGPVDITCPAGCLAWWSYGKLVSGRDSNLQVVIPPPGGLYRTISGPSGGLRAGAMDSKRVGPPSSTNFRCVAGSRKCVFAGGPCIVLFSVSPGAPGYSITAACAAAFFNDDGSVTAGSCIGDMLSVTDLVRIVEYSQVYT
ncbi:glycoside hydrolase [Byssothecium circinans]|uniref:Glycoside hydrolase n=1 Tax=Byssothecium circinans TaxID=147558 RepID=A0A6A5TIV0_9PLEO|nr:glycoside hydrolase [Byssothecium circinans]